MALPWCMAPLIESVRREAGLLQYMARGVTLGRAPFPRLRLTALLISQEFPAHVFDQGDVGD
jgi:hypothetical protein